MTWILYLDPQVKCCCHNCYGAGCTDSTQTGYWKRFADVYRDCLITFFLTKRGSCTLGAFDHTLIWSTLRLWAMGSLPRRLTKHVFGWLKPIQGRCASLYIYISAQEVHLDLWIVFIFISIIIIVIIIIIGSCSSSSSSKWNYLMIQELQ